MKMRSLGGDSDVEEVMTYLEKRHPLYFVHHKLKKDQVKELVKKLIFKLKQKGVKASGSLVQGGQKPAASTAKTGKGTSAAKDKTEELMAMSKPPAVKSKLQMLKELEKQAREEDDDVAPTKFKTGSQLPSMSDDFPSLPGMGGSKPGGSMLSGPGFGAKNARFDMGFDDELSAGDMEDMESPDEADNDDDEDFDANELMNLNSYQNKRMGLNIGIG